MTTDRMIRAALAMAASFGILLALFAAAPAAANDFMHQNCMRNADNQYARCVDNADRQAPNSFMQENAKRRCEAARVQSARQCDAALERRERMRPNNANRR